MKWLSGRTRQRGSSGVPDAPAPARAWTRAETSGELLVRHVRNLLCCLLAALLVVTGVTALARRRSLGRNVITPVYFHRPTRTLFLRCIRWLHRHGYVFVSADDVTAFLYHRKELPQGAVWISFDDGCRELLHEVLPVCEQYGVPVTLFIASALVAGNGVFPWRQRRQTAREADGESQFPPNEHRDCFSVEELKAVSARPFVTIGAHTAHHAVTTDCNAAELNEELLESRRHLEMWTQRPVRYFAYPYGRFDGRERPVIAECGYLLAATTESALIASDTDPYLVPRFSVADTIYFPEVVCNLVGVWRPLADPVKSTFRRWLRIGRQDSGGRRHATEARLPN